MNLFAHVSNSTKMKESLADHYAREAEEHGANLWSLYSTLTFYASHNDGAFSLRRSVEEQDTVAITMLHRELNVAKWIASAAWRELENA